MNVKEAAAALNGSQYREEGSAQLFVDMKSDGLVAVFGASDDLMEFRGAIDDEVGCYDGGTAYLTREGLLTNRCSDQDCPYFARLQKDAATIEAVWCGPEVRDGWSYRTKIPHETFHVMEIDEIYCRGIVFRLEDVAP